MKPGPSLSRTKLSDSRNKSLNSSGGIFQNSPTDRRSNTSISNTGFGVVDDAAQNYRRLDKSASRKPPIPSFKKQPKTEKELRSNNASNVSFGNKTENLTTEINFHSSKGVRPSTIKSYSNSDVIASKTSLGQNKKGSPIKKVAETTNQNSDREKDKDIHVRKRSYGIEARQNSTKNPPYKKLPNTPVNKNKYDSLPNTNSKDSLNTGAAFEHVEKRNNIE
jgi:hypothetical protein